MRVVQVVHSDGFAGVERYVAGLANGLSSAGVSSVVIGGNRDRMLEELGPAGVQWLPGDTARDVLSGLLLARGADIIHAHMTEAELAAIAIAPVIRSKVVVTRHFAQRRGSSLPARIIGGVITSRVAAQVAIGRFTADQVEGPSIVVPPATSRVSTAVRTAAERERIVLVAQRLEAEKRTDLALRAWARSRLAGQGWFLEIAGSGAYRTDLEVLARSLQIADSVRFLGQLRDMHTKMDQAAVLLAPRADEPFGISVIEAMAAGLPVVAAAGGGHLETIGRVADAALYEPHDINAAAATLEKLASDPDRRDRYAADQRRVHEEHFTVEAQVAATIDVYRQVMK